ncbi:energy-coupling factor transporter transmembrane component T [Oribacterium parvum]|uniref:energy-coupling factor transporter transmembrane component T n=1 Tax=Oribacterium parvum TaxID=1501329 RepID=UPI00056BEDAD|nr:energy-coupling factor transporter transmembrane component T [Oribacterium parvum]
MKGRRLAPSLRYDLRTKFIVLMLVNLLLFLGNSIAYEAFLTLLCLFVIISGGYIRPAVQYILLFTLSITVETIVVNRGHPFFLSLILFLVVIMRKFLPSVIIGKWILSSTSSSLAVATLQRMRVPKDALIMISVIFRCFPTIQEEWSNIYLAMKTRGISLDFYNFVHRPMLTMEYFFVPLFVSVMEIGDELSQSAIVRGIDAPVAKTCRHRIQMKTDDYMLLSLFFFVLVIVVFLRFLGYWL